MFLFVCREAHTRPARPPPLDSRVEPKTDQCVRIVLGVRGDLPGLANSAHKALRSALPVPRFNYGMPERLIPLIDQGVGDEPIIHDLVSFLSGKLNKKISYLEIGPSSPFRVLACAARTLNVPGQSRVTLSLQ